MAEDPPGYERDFDAIEAAVLETARGRWFLAEFARRNRAADTLVLLEAIGRLGSVTGTDTTTSADLGVIGVAIASAHAEIAAGAPPSTSGTAELHARMVAVTRGATADILDATERMQEAAWGLREAGIDPAICEELDRRAAEILSACAFQDANTTRVQILLDTLRIVEERLGLMRGRLLASDGALRSEEATSEAGGHPAPSASAVGDPASEVGDLVFEPRPQPSRPADPRSPAPPASRPVPAALAALDALDFRERLKLST